MDMFDQPAFQPGVDRPTYGPMRGAAIKPVRRSSTPYQFPGQQAAPEQAPTGMPSLGAEQQFAPQQPQAPRGMQQQPMGAPPMGMQPSLSEQGRALNEAYQNAPPLPGQVKKPGPQDDYIRAYEQLEKSRQAVAVDPRFSPEQRQQAFERIAARADELDQGYLAGQELMQSPIGYDMPPAEEFGIMQGGLETVGGGQIRNPATGDIMPSIKSPTGEIIPAPQTQPEIDSLPEGSKYVNPETGDVEVVGGAKSKSRSGGGSSASTASRAVQELDMTPDDAAAAFEKWNSKQDPMSTAEERAVVQKIISSLPDDQEQQIMAQIEANPESAIELLSQFAPNMNIGEELESARISAFAREEKGRKGRVNKVAQALGMQLPEAEKAPVVNPDRYLVETGNQGTTRIRRRGNRQFSIPAVRGEDGEYRPAPNAVRELADLDVDSEFVNIRPTEGGKQVRVLPFSAKTVNLENFALDDEQRAVLASESGGIKPRGMEEWNRFEDELRKFSVTNEVWNPDSLSPAQEQLQSLVNNFYRELSPKGRAAMTMYVAHSLGHEVSEDRDFTSTGWVNKKIPQSQQAQQAQPAMTTGQQQGQYRDSSRSTIRNQMIPAALKAATAAANEPSFGRSLFGDGSNKAYEQNIQNIGKAISQNVDSMFIEQGKSPVSDTVARKRLLLEEIDQLAKEITTNPSVSAQEGNKIIDDLYAYVGETKDWRTKTKPTKAAQPAPQAAQPTKSQPAPVANQAAMSDQEKASTAASRRKGMRIANADDYDIQRELAISEVKNRNARNQVRDEEAKKQADFKAKQAEELREWERQNLPISSKRQEEIARVSPQMAADERRRAEARGAQTAAQQAQQAKKQEEFKAKQAEDLREWQRQNLPVSDKRTQEIAEVNRQKAIADRRAGAAQNSQKARFERDENLRIIERSERENEKAREAARREEVRKKYELRKKPNSR